MPKGFFTPASAEIAPSAMLELQSHITPLEPLRVGVLQYAARLKAGMNPSTPKLRHGRNHLR